VLSAVLGLSRTLLIRERQREEGRWGEIRLFIDSLADYQGGIKSQIYYPTPDNSLLESVYSQTLFFSLSLLGVRTKGSS
jgi:hypothetical protein